jgi:hypothetical protein
MLSGAMNDGKDGAPVAVQAVISSVDVLGLTSGGNGLI